MDSIVAHLREKYQPIALIVYGSYADGTNGEGSDFDCLIVSENAAVSHDTAIVHGVPLDAFIYRPDELRGEIDPYDFVQIAGGVILSDTDGIAEELMAKVRVWLEHLPFKSRDELLCSIAWCQKMADRASRGDSEGYFRWHWLLCDSLELYFDLHRRRYLGPKKSLRDMKKLDPEGYALYSEALQDFTHASLSSWIAHLQRISDQLL